MVLRTFLVRGLDPTSGSTKCSAYNVSFGVEEARLLSAPIDEHPPGECGVAYEPHDPVGELLRLDERVEERRRQLFFLGL